MKALSKRGSIFLPSNRSAIGAKVYLTATIDGQAVTQLRTISSQTGYAGQNSLTTHFGLSNASIVSEVMIKWPSGLTSTYNNLSVNNIFISMESKTTAVSSERLSEEEIQLMPNPNSEYFILSFTNPYTINHHINLTILNAQGKVVAEQVIQNSKSIHEKVNVSTLPIGIYEVIIKCDNRYIGRKRFARQ